MTVLSLADPRVAKLRKRMRELKALRTRVADEILLIDAELARIDGTNRRRRSRHIKPSCATDEGYHWHRYNEPDNWPLPKNDPCGCRAAHSAHERVKAAERRLRKAREMREAS